MKNKIFIFSFLTAIGCSSSESVEPVVLVVPSVSESQIDQLLGIDSSELTDDDDIINSLPSNTPPDTVSNSTTLSLDAFGPIDSIDTNTESIPGEELIGELEVVNSASRGGINIQIVNYGFIDALTPRVTLRLDNKFDSPIFNATCNVKLFEDGVEVKESIALFARFAVIDVGESAVYPVPFFDMATGFDGIDKLEMTCDWEEGFNNQIDIVTDPVRFEILDFSMSIVGRPSVRVLATNNSGISISGAQCQVKAKIENVILDSASVRLGTIEPGEAKEDSGIFFFFDSLEGFSLELFDEYSMDCRYR